MGEGEFVRIARSRLERRTTSKFVRLVRNVGLLPYKRHPGDCSSGLGVKVLLTGSLNPKMTIVRVILRILTGVVFFWVIAPLPSLRFFWLWVSVLTMYRWCQNVASAKSRTSQEKVEWRQSRSQGPLLPERGPWERGWCGVTVVLVTVWGGNNKFCVFIKN